MTFLCRACFLSATWVSNADPKAPSIGSCSFGHGAAKEVWDAKAWIEPLTAVAQLYEPADAGTGGDRLPAAIQSDWNIFILDEAQISAVLADVLGPKHELLESESGVSLRSINGSSSTRITSWEAFAQEITRNNRYFPSVIPDLSELESVLVQAVQEVPEGTVLFRARIVERDVRLGVDDLGAPPRQRATGGRANPPGIPYLYLAFELDTAIYEVRPTQHATISVGNFETVRALKAVNLTAHRKPEFFDVEDPSYAEQQIERIVAYRYLRGLALELSRPVRKGDEPLDYIPTQYLCEFAKSRGFDGVVYKSSMHGDGTNIVLFDAGSARCVSVGHHVVTSLVAELDSIE